MGYKLKRILIYPDGVTEKQVYPAGWKPNANTIAYYPLDTDFNDANGNYNMTAKAGSPTITTLNGVKCCYFNGSSDIGNDNLHSSTIGGVLTVSGWVRINSNKEMDILTMQASGDASGFFMGAYNGQTYGINTGWNNNGTKTEVKDTTPIAADTWKHICITASGNNNGTIKLYQNGTLVKTQNNVSFTTSSTNSYARIGGSKFSSSGVEGYFSTGYASRVIIENRVRTADEISDYYNYTKSNYGL